MFPHIRFVRKLYTKICCNSFVLFITWHRHVRILLSCYTRHTTHDICRHRIGYYLEIWPRLAHRGVHTGGTFPDISVLSVTRPAWDTHHIHKPHCYEYHITLPHYLLKLSHLGSVPLYIYFMKSDILQTNGIQNLYGRFT